MVRVSQTYHKTLTIIQFHKELQDVTPDYYQKRDKFERYLKQCKNYWRNSEKNQTKIFKKKYQ